jgi:medium-chain acyl-[acyl-carrier-protein] hydrolase
VLQPYLDLPFAFFGHSMGALISFEVARQLRRQGTSPVHLFISGRRAPQIPDRHPRMYMLPDSEFLEELRQLNGTSDVVLNNPELMQLLLPTLRSDFAMCGTYTYVNEPPFDCPISVFGGLEDTTETRDQLEGWKTQTCSYFTLQMLPGDHFFLRTSQQILLDQIVHQLNKT